MVGFTPRSLHPRRKSGAHRKGGLTGHSALLNALEKRTILDYVKGDEFLDCLSGCYVVRNNFTAWSYSIIGFV